jgi:predicted nucleic acid-binding protein
LIDEADARREAAGRNLAFMGTLGVLRLAARLDLIDLPSDLVRLQQTTFYVDPELIHSLLAEDAARKEQG